MGKFGKFAIGTGLTMVGLIAAFNAIGNSVEQNFAAQANEESMAFADTPVGKTTPEPEQKEEKIEVALSTPQIGRNMLEQAIFDTFSNTAPKTKADKKKTGQAADFVGATINSQGYLCHRPVEVVEAADGQYGIGCITHRSGNGRSIYLVDVRSGSVSPLS